jgi:hypothetical protein
MEMMRMRSRKEGRKEGRKDTQNTRRGREGAL